MVTEVLGLVEHVPGLCAGAESLRLVPDVPAPAQHACRGVAQPDRAAEEENALAQLTEPEWDGVTTL